MNALLPLIALSVCVTHAFNLEPRIPIIKRGFEGSYFGYSVAEHIDVSSPISISKYVHFMLYINTLMYSRLCSCM